MPSEALFYPGMRVGEVIRLSAGLRRKDCAGEADLLLNLIANITDSADFLRYITPFGYAEGADIVTM